MNRTCAWLAAAVTVLWPVASRGATVVSSTVRAPLVGRLATPAAGQSNIGFYATDLGFTMVARDQNGNKQLRVVFGDSWSNPGVPIGLGADDSQGIICLGNAGCPAGLPLFPDGDAVDSYVNQSPLHGLSWQHEAPPVFMRTNLFGLVAPQPIYRGGIFGTLLNMGPARTPVAVFSNGLLGAAAGAYGIFLRNVFLQCSGGLLPACSNGFSCDRTLGSVGGDTSEQAVPCVLGTSGCVGIPAGGFCVDTTSSVYTGTDHRIAGVNRLEIGNADPLIQEQYYCQDWYSNKFVNPSARTVNDFLPGRANGAGNDYGAPDDTTTGREAVLLWGRPAFAASGGRAEVYFAYAPVPSYDPNGNFAWAPQYYTKTTNGVPQFSPNQNLAAPLVLGSTTTDNLDVVNQMTVSWVAPIHQWVMIYGGDVWDSIVPYGQTVQHDPNGAVQIRFAPNPWGPWTAPQTLLAAGNHTTGTLQYGNHGILYSSLCTSDCVPHETGLDLYFPNPVPKYGFFYGASVIDAWTMARTTPSVGADIYWTVSTFDPYQVVLMRSRINQ